MMAARSTRNKLRHHAKQAIDKCDAISQSLFNIDALSSGESDYINEHLPMVVVAVSQLKEVLTAFRDGL